MIRLSFFLLSSLLLLSVCSCSDENDDESPTLQPVVEWDSIQISMGIDHCVENTCRGQERCLTDSISRERAYSLCECEIESVSQFFTFDHYRFGNFSPEQVTFLNSTRAICEE